MCSLYRHARQIRYQNASILSLANFRVLSKTPKTDSILSDVASTRDIMSLSHSWSSVFQLAYFPPGRNSAQPPLSAVSRTFIVIASALSTNRVSVSNHSADSKTLDTITPACPVWNDQHTRCVCVYQIQTSLMTCPCPTSDKIIKTHYR